MSTQALLCLPCDSYYSYRTASTTYIFLKNSYSCFKAAEKIYTYSFKFANFIFRKFSFLFLLQSERTFSAAPGHYFVFLQHCFLFQDCKFVSSFYMYYFNFLQKPAYKLFLLSFPVLPATLVSCFLPLYKTFFSFIPQECSIVS
jgi:hypothetical protein